MKRGMKISLSACLLAGLAIGLSACQQNLEAGDVVPEETTSQVVADQLESLTEADLPEETGPASTITIRTIGDILPHNTVYQDAYNGGGYDFTHMFEPVKPYIEGADITFANLEVIAAGSVLGPSTYPVFNSPEEIIDALQYVGVDIVNNNSNHTLDFGASGAYASIQALRDRGMMYIGSYDSWEDYQQPRIIEANGISVGFLSYCYGANGNTVSEEEGYLFTQIDKDLIQQEVTNLAQQVDICFVTIQAGEEYSFLPNENQLYIQQVAREAGANIILGGHPHYVQPFAYHNDQQVSMYSHGNFLSGQYEVYEKLGGIAEFTFSKQGDQVRCEGIRFMPTYNYGLPEGSSYLVLPLVDAAGYGLGQAEVDAYYQEFVERMTYFTDQVEVVPYF